MNDCLQWIIGQLESGEPMSGREAKLAGAYVRLAVVRERAATTVRLGTIEEKVRAGFFDDTLESMVRAGLIIPAIKLVWKLNGQGLREAKKHVDRIEDRLSRNGEI